MDIQRIKRLTATINGYNYVDGYAKRLDFLATNGLAANDVVYFGSAPTAPQTAGDRTTSWGALSLPAVSKPRLYPTEAPWPSPARSVYRQRADTFYTLAGGVGTGTDWSGALIGTDNKIDTNGVSNGHVMSWSFHLDSAKVAGAAAKNVGITFAAFDAIRRRS